MIPWCAVRSKSFRLTRDVETDESASDRVQDQWIRLVWSVSCSEISSVVYLRNVYFSTVANMQMKWHHSEQLRAQSPCSHCLCLVGVVVIVLLSWERKQTLNSVNQWQRELSQVTWMSLHCPDSEGRLGWSREGTASCFKDKSFVSAFKMYMCIFKAVTSVLWEIYSP